MKSIRRMNLIEKFNREVEGEGDAVYGIPRRFAEIAEEHFKQEVIKARIEELKDIYNANGLGHVREEFTPSKIIERIAQLKKEQD